LSLFVVLLDECIDIFISPSTGRSEKRGIISLGLRPYLPPASWYTFLDRHHDCKVFACSTQDTRLATGGDLLSQAQQVGDIADINRG